MTHAQRSWTCRCGRTVWGNGGKSSHRRACPVYKGEVPAPILPVTYNERRPVCMECRCVIDAKTEMYFRDKIDRVILCFPCWQERRRKAEEERTAGS